MKTLHLQIHGRVQGVFYRESMCREALRLTVGGWVRNCSDGSVEAVVHGEDDAVEALIAWASRGPDRARVERIEVTPASGSYTVFERLPSA